MDREKAENYLMILIGFLLVFLSIYLASNQTQSFLTPAKPLWRVVLFSGGIITASFWAGTGLAIIGVWRDSKSY